MARGINRLTVKTVANLKKTGMHADGGGLYLTIKGGGARSWAFIYQWHGRRREMGLGSASVVTLSEARDKRDEAKRLLAAGKDPSAPVIENAGEVTFGQEAEALIASLEGSWKNEKHKYQWKATLREHCSPIWDRPVASIETRDVLDVLNPIWLAIPETANRLRGRIERVLDGAKVKGLREGENPARWRGHLEVILPKRKRLAVRNHPAMSYKETPEFVRVHLKRHISMAARALEFLILTAGRTTEVLGAKWNEVDLEAKLWIVPGERMKAGKEHRVPLSPAAVVVLEAMRVFGSEPTSYVFPGRKPGSKLSNMAMEMLLRRMKYDSITVHGFRSTFRDWAGEETDFPREVAEAALAHEVGNAVERAYRRGDALAKRRALMEAWAEYLAKVDEEEIKKAA